MKSKQSGSITNHFAVDKVAKRSLTAYRGPHFLVCTSLFWTSFVALLMTIGIFAVAMANSVLLAREYEDYQIHVVLSTVVLSFAASGIVQCFLHLWFARFDKDNRTQRLWIILPLLLFFSAFLIHNVFWFIGVKYYPDSFPSPNSAAFSIAGFALSFVIAFSSWYQARYLMRLYI